MTRATGGLSADGSRSATATGSRFTADPSPVPLDGVLFLTAGCGTRAEPLSFLRPKALLPWAGGTVLGRLASSFRSLLPENVAANASRCPDLIRGELERASGRCCRLFFESRPLGARRTLACLDGIARGSWFIVNTDMVFDEDLGAMLEYHRRSSSDWTILAGPPLEGFRPLPAAGDGTFGTGPLGVHFWGVGIFEPGVFSLAATRPGADIFGGLASAAAGAGMRMRVYEASGDWIDTGEVESYRRGLLSKGSFVHPGAMVEDGVEFEGRWYVGEGCFLGRGSRISDSVMLDGSRLEGARLSSTVLPWLAAGRPAEMNA